MQNLERAPAIQPVLATPTRVRVFLSAARYLAGKTLTILATIFAGVFLTLLLVNYPAGPDQLLSPFDQYLEQEINTLVQIAVGEGLIPMDLNGPLPAAVEKFKQPLRHEAGLDLPFLPRYLLWTSKALTFDWGRLDSDYMTQISLPAAGGPSPSLDIILQAFPNTLLLVGTAYLLTFLIGMPLSLYLARHNGSLLDQLFSVLAPISSVPSWVFGALLVTIFAVQLRWLPVSGMFGFHKPEEPLAYALTLLQHMALPVLALLLSLVFQLVYTWRTFFILYSQEDYVELGRAKGLDTRALEKQYILKPGLPYVITSFATSLIGFWQLTVALEKIFQWPGIGTLYLSALPNYWHDRVQYGDLMLVVQIVVIFSYVLGLLAFLLDLVYVIVDPRIHLIPKSSVSQTKTRATAKSGLRLLRRRRRDVVVPARRIRNSAPRAASSQQSLIHTARETLQGLRMQAGLFAQQFRQYPSAIFGLVILTGLVVGSLYAVLFLPYEEIGREFDAAWLSGRNLVPRMAGPQWLNVFSPRPFLSTLILEENTKGAQVSYATLDNGWVQKTVTFTFNYSYRDIPSDVFIYLDSKYKEKMPFVSMKWTTPDGRTINLKSRAIRGQENFDLQANLNIPGLLLENPEWKTWFVRDGQYPTPAYYLLFARPGSETPAPHRGTYQLQVSSLFFEEGSDLQAQLVLLGQVYGVAGTDFWRRDLVVPLLWGMPFTLLVGFLGTFLTTLVALLLPAIGVWFGGGLDSFIQRLTEINMVLPGLAIAVLLNAVFNTPIWIVLGIVVVLNAFGAPIKTFRSALLQAKEAPYIEMARSYGAGNFRIITRYLVPRILPVLIPALVAQIPSFVFLEATLGFFNIKSIYPSWGHIIYDALSKGALYGSPFWVLEPIFLLLLTGLAFAMLGAALERILNPRIIETIPVVQDKK